MSMSIDKCLSPGHTFFLRMRWEIQECNKEKVMCHFMEAGVSIVFLRMYWEVQIAIIFFRSFSTISRKEGGGGRVCVKNWEG